MTRLDDYRSALRAGFAEVSDEALECTLDERGADFAAFIIDHGLGPLWHARTGREEFRESRMRAEALYLAQDKALLGINAVLDAARVGHVAIKGAANRRLLYDNPALRACHDLDLLVHPDERVRAVKALADAGFAPMPKTVGISRGLVLRRSDTDVDLHWGLLREGRLRADPVAGILERRRRMDGVWMPGAEDTLFLLLVHPAFAKHLGGWDMGLHRVLDILEWLRTQPCDWSTVCERLDDCGVRTAAWATLRWADLLATEHSPGELATMLSDMRPGGVRAAWIDGWLRHDLSARLASRHRLRLLGLSPFLHDSPRDVLRAVAGRYRAHRRRDTDMEAFRELLGQ